MSAECDWCEGVGCEECTGAAAANDGGGDGAGELELAPFGERKVILSVSVTAFSSPRRSLRLV